MMSWSSGSRQSLTRSSIQPGTPASMAPGVSVLGMMASARMATCFLWEGRKNVSCEGSNVSPILANTLFGSATLLLAVTAIIFKSSLLSMLAE